MGEIKKRRGGAGRGQGRRPKPKPPEVADKQFAARVLALVGSARWAEMLAAVTVWRAYTLGHDYKSEQQSEKKTKTGAPPHPKTLVESDEDLALYYLIFNDDRSMFVTLIEKRDGKAVHTVNHLHDKPIEMNHTISLGEGMKIAMQKAEERVRSRS